MFLDPLRLNPVLLLLEIMQPRDLDTVAFSMT